MKAKDPGPHKSQCGPASSLPPPPLLALPGQVLMEWVLLKLSSLGLG